MKQGLLFENGEWIYYQNDRPCHAGVVKVDGEIYYIGRHGRVSTGEHVVHGEMTNGLLKRGTYTFGPDGKLVPGSYVAPKKRKRKLRDRLRLRKGFGKKTLFPFITVGLVCVTAIGIILGVTELGNVAPAEEGETRAVTETGSDGIRVVMPEFTGEVLLCSEPAKGVFDRSTSIENAVASGNPYRPLTFSYILEGATGTLSLWESENPEATREYPLAEGACELLIDNLKTGTAYTYRAAVAGQNYEGSFQTARSMRFVTIPGLHNTRDIGGYATLDGKTVKQGLVIRGIELDGLVEPTYFIPGEELEAVREEFGFVCDLDLRAPGVFAGDYKTRLGSDVAHRFYMSPMYGGIFSETYIPSVREIFRDLADPENYPMYLHCTYGTDRTGTIVFLLQGVLNVSEEDMVNEYKLTGFSNPAIASSDNLDSLLYGLESYRGDTVGERIVDYLTTTVGVTQGEIDAIRDIFLEN